MRRWAALIAIAAFAVLVVTDAAPRTGPEEHIVVIGSTAMAELTVTHQTFVEAYADDIAREMVTVDRRTPSTTEEALHGHLQTAAPRTVLQTPDARLLRPGTVVPALALFAATLLIVRHLERRSA